MLLHSVNFNRNYYTYKDALNVLKNDMGLVHIYHRKTDNYFMFRINKVNKNLDHFITHKFNDLFYKVYQY